MNRIREGYVRWMNPFSKAIYQVSLEPDDVSAIVFWSKNYLPLVPHLDELDVRGWPMWNCLGRSRQRNWTHNQQSSSG